MVGPNRTMDLQVIPSLVLKTNLPFLFLNEAPAMINKRNHITAKLKFDR